MEDKFMKEPIPPGCKQHFRAVRDTLHIVSGKWKILIIAGLVSGKKRYLELQRALEGIGTKMLSKDLQELEMYGLVKRSVMDTRPITVTYELTDYGRTLKPITDAMATWGTAHREKLFREM